MREQAGRIAADEGMRLAQVLALCGFLCATADVQAAAPGSRLGRAPVLARSCLIKPPDIAPLFASAPVAPSAAATATDDDDDTDDDSDDEYDENDDESVPGLILPGSSTCLAISGTVTAGLQFDSYRIPRAGDSAPRPATTWLPGGSLRIATAQDTSWGLRIGTAFEMSLNPTKDQPDALTLDEATVTVGTMTFGLASSRFSFWTGDEFAFSARLPGRNAALIGWERDLTESWNLALAAEDPTVSASSSVPVAMGRVPDGVARLTYAAGDLTLHLAGVLRDVAGTTPKLGRAGIVGATYQMTVLGRPGEITAQIAGATDAAAYIGSPLDATAARQVVVTTDSTRGFSSVVAARREWTDEWASNIYVSRYQIAVPLTDRSTGKLRIDRASANLVWTPVAGFKAGIEGSIAWSRIAIANRAVPASLGGRLLSAQLFIERSF